MAVVKKKTHIVPAKSSLIDSDDEGDLLCGLVGLDDELVHQSDYVKESFGKKKNYGIDGVDDRMLAEEIQARELAEMQEQMQSMDLAESMRLAEAGQQDPGMAGSADPFGAFGFEEPAHGEPVGPNGAPGSIGLSHQ